MLLAGMNNYGRDDNGVGVDGILGCMGVFVAYGTRLYVIHSPDNGNKALGLNAFANYIQNDNVLFDGTNARVFAVLNGTNRPAADDEVRTFCNTLGASGYRISRLMRNLGNARPDSLESAVIVCRWENGIAGGEVEMVYQSVNHVAFTYGTGTAAASGYGGHVVVANPKDVAGTVGWHLITPAMTRNVSLTAWCTLL